MIDSVVINLRSGNGGDGAISGRREKFVARGGPDGGNGGDGGSIYLVSDANLNTLVSYRYRRHYESEDGEKGGGKLKHGKNGADLTLTVPVGTMVWVEGADGELIADLDTAGEQVRVARGGRGGAGNTRYATPTNRFPLLAQAGEASEKRSLRLELKLLADVGIIGAPNAGKSSLLASLTAARPKIAEYPFTTLEPALGVVEHRDESFVMVDIPGLIEGAHEGVGLGQDFLRHIERTRVLVHMVDGSIDDPVGQVQQTNTELELFSEDLGRKPQLLAVNKIDIPEVRERMSSLESEFGQAGGVRYVHFVSAAAADGLVPLMDAVLRELRSAPMPTGVRTAASPGSGLPVLRPRPRGAGVSVSKDSRGVYVVDSPDAARIAAMVDVGNWGAKMQYYARLRRTGVVKALEDAGIMPGDTVRIGDVEMEWE
jgi:GTP-binding protein